MSGVSLFERPLLNIGFLCLVLISVAVCDLMPLPSNVKSLSASFTTMQRPINIKIQGVSGADLTTVRRSTDLWTDVAFPGPKVSGRVTTIRVLVSGTEDLALGMNEAYQLHKASGDSTITITAATQVGVCRAFATLADLADPVYGSSQLRIPDSFDIADSPRFAWRGMLIDSARHYLSPATMRRQVVALALAKFNVLHWHLQDAQSWSVSVASEPRLTAAGSYHPGLTHTTDDVRSLISLATDLGVRVVPEVDTPGHAAVWKKIDPKLVADCGPSLSHNINNIPLNPTNPQAYEAVEAVLKDLAAEFPDKHMHLGGDEVVTRCFDRDAGIAAWMKAHHMTSHQMEGYWHNNIYNHGIKPLNRIPVYWNELFEKMSPAPGGAVFEVWNSMTEAKKIAAAGHDLIYATPWYLDKQVPAPPTSYLWVDTWRPMYDADPTAGMTAAEARHVIGGEAAMWSETVDDHTIDGRVWPRALAVAERLWSPASVKDKTDAAARMNVKRCALQRVGVWASPIHPSAPCAETTNQYVWM